jgi:hypothetical protein
MPAICFPTHLQDIPPLNQVQIALHLPPGKSREKVMGLAAHSMVSNPVPGLD